MEDLKFVSNYVFGCVAAKMYLQFCINIMNIFFDALISFLKLIY